MMILRISSKRRKELRANVLMNTHDLFRVCLEFDQFVMCRDDWSSDVENELYQFEDSINFTTTQMNFYKNELERHYVRKCFRKYACTTLKVILDRHTCSNKLEIEKLKAFRKSSIKKLRSSI